MRSAALNAARRLGKAHGHDPLAPTYTPRACTAEPLRRRYWTARSKAERDGTIAVWNEFQRVPAALYAAAHMPRAVIVVDARAGVRSDARRNVLRYHFA